MKSITVTFDDHEFANLIKYKGRKTWHDYILLIKMDKIKITENDLKTLLKKKKLMGKEIIIEVI